MKIKRFGTIVPLNLKGPNNATILSQPPFPIAKLFIVIVSEVVNLPTKINHRYGRYWRGVSIW